MHDLIHMIVSATIHGAIYDAIFKATRGMPTPAVLAICGGLVVAAGIVWLMTRR